VFAQLTVLLRITRAHLILRRYFVVNGFDGALTMLGLLVGFYMSDEVSLFSMINACLAVAIALGVSGITSAYFSEAAEKQAELRELESAMLADLEESAYGRAARMLPFVIAFVNGLAPLLFSLIIMTPLWLKYSFAGLAIAPVETAIIVAAFVIFMLGVFLGRVSGVFWLWSGLRMLLVAVITTGLIYLVSSSTY